VVQVCPFRPLYYSASLITDIWNLAITLLQLSGKSDLRISQVQIQVAWILIGALMSLGSHFIKSHLSQLLLLWQNALPRSLPREAIVSRSSAELQYLLHVRERSLAALHLFLLYNGKMVTYDISKRIVSMLSDTVAFVARLPLPHPTDDARLLNAQLQLAETVFKIRTSVFRCYSTLSRCDQRYSAGPEILMTAISIFTDPDLGGLKSGTSMRALNSGAFESLSSIEDNFSFGVSGHLKKLTIPGNIRARDKKQVRHWSMWTTDSDLLDDVVNRIPWPSNERR
jgi:HEAT repeat-containing protein 5